MPTHTAETPATGVKQTNQWARASLAAVLATLVVSLVVLAFTWPTKTSETKDLPLSIAGPEASISQIEATLNEKQPGVIDFVEADSRDQAISQIEQRETYGAIILPQEEGGAPEILTAPASSTAATQILNQMATQLTTQIQTQAAETQTAQL